MLYALAAAPILIVLALMLGARWGGQRAGPAGWLAGVAVAALAFGLTPEVAWVSQAKGLLLSLYVLAVLWPALLLFNVVRQIGGIRALGDGLQRALADRGLLLPVVAWAFAGALEGLAGFGIPIAVASPMLVGLGVAPLTAVAAVAVGHAWAVTFGDMGVIFQSLIAVTGLDGAALAPSAALMLGAACLGCGLASARLLGQARRWPAVLAIGALMAAVQYGLAVAGLAPLAALGAGLAGVGGAVLLGRLSGRAGGGAPGPVPSAEDRRALRAAVLTYGGLAALMAVLIGVPAVKAALDPLMARPLFPAVATTAGFTTPAGPGQAFRFLTHPGASILLVALAAQWAFRRRGLAPPGSGRAAQASTWRSAWPASIGIVTMVGLATLMEHAGMTQLLAQGLGQLMGAAFPIVSPLIGMLGAFATGSNTNSNVLFAPLQKSAAELLGLAPVVLVAAQTAGGSLGSLLAPAKLVVGCSTVGLAGRDGEVLRRTLPYGLTIGLGLGVLAMVLAQAR
jgi:lactate permease